jgi:hypothetical protein
MKMALPSVLGIASLAMSCCDSPSMSANRKSRAIKSCVVWVLFEIETKEKCRIIDEQRSCCLSDRKQNYNLILEIFGRFCLVT